LTRFFIALTKSVTQNIRGVTERLLRAAHRMLGICMQLLDECFITTVLQATPTLLATVAIGKPKQQVS